MKKRILTAVFLAVITLVISGCSLFAGKDLQVEVLSVAEQEERIATIAQNYPESVVTVFTYNKNTNNSVSLGSGVVVRDNGFIVTNHHVISKIVDDEANFEAKVAFDSSNSLYPATIEWHNIQLDLAIIKVNLIGLDYVPMKDRSFPADPAEHYFASQVVVAIGTPLDFTLQNTVTVGRISSKAHRVSVAENGVYEDLIQHTAPINHGNSGGGLFDLDGNLIGLNTLGHDDANSLFFAVPIYPIIEVLDTVINAYNLGQKHRAGVLGITALDRFQAGVTFEGSGLIVLSVSSSGASHGKLFEGDIIKKVTVNSKQTVVDIRNNFVYALLNTTAGTTITLLVERGGLNISVSVTLD